MNKIRESGWNVKVEKDVPEILTENAIPLASINSIIWSHWHWDHTGDPSLFPLTTSLTVGPGFKKAKTPGYPTNPNSSILESAYKDRELVEISFNQVPELGLGQFRAFDYFGDGSFYLLDSPGHAIGHMCALARSTPDTFILMGGDICHHAGEMRPTQHLPLPDFITPNPFRSGGPPCLGSLLMDLHPSNSITEPFYHVADLPDGKSMYDNPPEAQQSLSKLEEFDGSENVFTIIAHDGSLFDSLNFFPKTLNNWKSDGLRERGMWSFLKNFKNAVELES